MSAAARSRPPQGLRLKKFDISRIKDTHKMVFVGKTGSGKSYTLRQVLSRFNDIPVGTVISQTEFANRFYSDFVPSKLIYDEYRPDIIHNYMKRQFAICNQYMDETKEYGSSAIDPRAFLILDDCLSAKADICKDRLIQYIFFAGRHVRTMFALCMQYPLGLTPDLRGNIDFVFIFREPNQQNRRRIFENYAGMFPSFDVFCQVMDQCTQNFECMVIDNTTTSNNLADQVFWFKADATPAFRLCDPKYWEDNHPFRSSLALANGSGETDFNPADARSRRGPVVTVKKQKF
jgi:ABC-type dipeptide/oligopeptide/nickel transport system ATPase component